MHLDYLQLSNLLTFIPSYQQLNIHILKNQQILTKRI